MKKTLLLAILLPTIGKSQLTRRDSLWLPMHYFVGKWLGEGKGEPGTGKYERSYSWTLNKRFIEVKNKAIYPPSGKNKNKGEIHEDIGYFSYDNSRKTFILRQFHVEGFVNQFKLGSISPDKKTIVFITEAIENIPNGWQAKETYWITSDTEMEETFELAEPNQDFTVYTKVKLVRQK